MKLPIILAVCCLLAYTRAETYECDVVGTYHCYLRNIVLTREDFNFTVAVEEPNAIRSVTIQNSHIPVLGATLCTFFPYLEFLHVDAASLEAFDINALKDCTTLKHLQLTGNRITELNVDSFWDLVNLRVLHLDWNRLRNLPDDVFQMSPKLQQLYLEGNELTEFSTAVVRGLNQIQSFTIGANNLFDIDSEGLIAELPLLKVFGFDQNKLRCSRLVQILENDIPDTLILVKSQRKKYKNSGAELENGWSCLENLQWTVEYNRATIEGQTDSLRKLFSIRKL